MKIQDKTIELVKKISQYSESGKLVKSKDLLNELYRILNNDPLILMDSEYSFKMGNCLSLYIHYDMFEKEEKNIGLIHLSYLYYSRAIELFKEDKDKLFQIRKKRLLLFRLFDDFFTDSLINIYFSTTPSENREDYLEQRKQVLNRIPILQLTDIFFIEQDFENLGNDEFLLESANDIESEISIDKETVQEGIVIHKLLSKFILEEIEKDDLIY
ncbi:MAG: hypothetical protein N4A49_14445 [Marinifilaceae bacterium]|jgi:hypothetical protein|nr:hypothetical protein [Marinifilaceae bacterium]